MSNSSSTTWLQRLFLLLFGVGLIALAEIALRLVGIGGASTLFVTMKAPDGNTYWVTNDKLNERLFFPATDADSDFPRPQVPFAQFARKKPEGTFRAFVVGASSSVGFPFSPNVSFAGYLREMMAAGSKKDVEVINTSMTAISSYQVGQWVREIVGRYDPDLVIVYSGHNELYGVLGAGSAMSVGSNRLLTNLFLEMQGTAMYSLVAKALERFNRPKTETDGPKGQPLEALTQNREVRPYSELYDSVVENYRKNLEGMVSAAKKRDVPIFLCTTASNRAGCSPMVPLHDEMFELANEREWDLRLRQGDTKRKTGDAEGARAEYQKARSIDGTHPGLSFRFGMLALDAGDVTGAGHEFGQALLYDGLQLRANDRLVNTVREVAGSDAAAERTAGAAAPPGPVALVDCVSRLDRESEAGVVGTDLIFEHVHPNARGHYFIACEIYEVLLAKRFPFERSGLLSFEDASDRTGYSAVDGVYANGFMRFMLRQWPFDGTFDNGRAVTRTEGAFRRSHDALDPIARETYDSHPMGGTVLHLHHRLGLAYLDANRPADAAGEFKLIARMLPNLADVQVLRAKSLALAGRDILGIANLERALARGSITKDELRSHPQWASFASSPDWNRLID